MTTTSTQIQLVSRPSGWPTQENFRTVTVELPELADGEVRVANDFLSVDPYMRGRMNDVKSYVPPFALGETLTGGAVGRVVASRADGVEPGTLVLHQLGWRDIAQGPAAEFRVVPEPPALPNGTALPASAYLGMLGLTGFTAYVGLQDVAGLREGETVFISGAAGAVGTAAGQVARLLGAARVVGSAGSPEKVALLTEKYGYDAAFDYKAGPVGEQLTTAAPQGIDVYFDNVGGEHLEAAIDAFNDGGRAALCGAISAYNSETPQPGPANLSNLISRGLTLEGFTVGRFSERYPAFLADMGSWIAAGRIAMDETVIDGVENTVDAFLSLMRGGNTGKMVVRV